MSLNSVILIGRICADPELRTTTSGKSVTSFSIAVQKRTKPTDGSSDADFFRVSCWDKTAEFVTNCLGKGRLIAVEGRLQSRKYQAQDGSTRESVEVVANAVQSLERPRDDEQGRPTGTRPAANSGANTPGVDEYDPFADE